MSLRFSRPEGFSDRVFLVSAQFDTPGFPSLVGFDVPNLPSWFFRRVGGEKFDTAPMCDSDSLYRGLIKDGRWEFIVQSNGFSLEENPISLDDLKDRLLSSMLAPLQ